MTCNNRHPELTFLACENVDNRHSGDHYWTSAEGEKTTWPNDRDVKQGPGFGDRRGRPQAQTYEHELAEAVTDGIKGEMITQQLIIYGQAFCVRCKTPLSPEVPMGQRLVDEHFELFVAVFKEAMRRGHKHHTDRRSGHGYRPSKYGHDWGRDLPVFIEAPLCQDCHIGDDSEIHPGVQLGRPMTVVDGGRQR